MAVSGCLAALSGRGGRSVANPADQLRLHGTKRNVAQRLQPRRSPRPQSDSKKTRKPTSRPKLGFLYARKPPVRPRGQCDQHYPGAAPWPFNILIINCPRSPGREPAHWSRRKSQRQNVVEHKFVISGFGEAAAHCHRSKNFSRRPAMPKMSNTTIKIRTIRANISAAL
jgi:hypothetical protein